MSDEILCVVPARYQSSRFPGKPLVPLLGVPMVVWVARACGAAVGRENVVVATDDRRIFEVVRDYGFTARMSSDSALTGTDRVAEVSAQSRVGTILNVQGDEPLVSPEDIRLIAQTHIENPKDVTNGYTVMSGQTNPGLLSIPKVVLDERDYLLYASRNLIPGSKFSAESLGASEYKKQVCIYAFSPAQLKSFSTRKERTLLESTEDIEILRFLEIGQRVKMVKTDEASLAVDSPADVAPVERALQKKVS